MNALFKQIDLAYGFAAVESHIDELTMVKHYTKHHASSATTLNAAIEKDGSLAGKSREEILLHLDAIGDSAVCNNRGGFVATTSPSIPSDPTPNVPLRGSAPTASNGTSARWSQG